MATSAAASSDLTVLEIQRDRLQSQQHGQQQQQHMQDLNYNPITNVSYLGESLFAIPSQETLGGGVAFGWPDLSSSGCPTLGVSGNDNQQCFGSIPTPLSKQVSEVPTATEKQSSSTSSGNQKKRKADNSPATKVVVETSEVKKMKGDAQKKTKTGEQKQSKKKDSDETKEEAVAPPPPKQDYIHVRARRGQATDSHSLAERVRRERISERMRYLQELVPGCSKITGKAGMLDEIINYVQSLQRQVEFLSMKLAAVNPRIDFNGDNIFCIETNPSCGSSISTVAVSPELMDPSYLQHNSLQQACCSGMDMAAMSQPEHALCRTLSTPINVPDQFLDPCFNVQVQGSNSGWNAELQNLYNVEFQQGRETVFPLQSYQCKLLNPFPY